MFPDSQIGEQVTRKRIFAAITAAVCSSIGAGALAFTDSRAPVVVELFTSQGCSSCPPADQLLATLADSFNAGPEIIVLSEHVDYWDYLGWKDPFSATIFTKRQHSYARALRQSNVYTPEMLVDGMIAFVGSDSRAALDAIGRRARKPNLKIALSAIPDVSKKSLAVALTDSGLKLSENERLIVFLTQTNLAVQVRSGENSGRTLNHTGVVRTVKTFDSVPIKHCVLPIPTNASVSSLRVVAIRQNKCSMEITGAGVTKIAQR